VQARAIVFAFATLMFLSGASAAQAAAIAVVKPAGNDTIHSNQGKLTVVLRRVDAPPGASVRLVLDGTARPKIHRRNVIKLDGIDRGSHSLQAVLLDANGKRVAVSAPVSFYMWHASRLFPNRK